MLCYEGAIELSILAEYYGREIAAYDIQTSRCDLYGQVRTADVFTVHFSLVILSLLTLILPPPIFQEKNYSERVMLIYDGLHYDSLAVCCFMTNLLLLRN